MMIFIYKDEVTPPTIITETDMYKKYFEKRGLMKSSKIFQSAYTTTITSEKVEVKLLATDINSIQHLGILKKNKSVFSFIDITIQEYLAAYYVSTLPSGEQLKEINDHIVHKDVVLKFFCGLTELKNINNWNVILAQPEYVEIRALRCIFESQNYHRCIELFTKANGKLLIIGKTLTLLDYYAIGYCMGKAILHVNDIVLQIELTAEGLDIITQFLKEAINDAQYDV